MKVTLVHWNEAEAQERARRLRSAGLTVAAIVHGKLGPDEFKRMWARPPDAYVIDLTRLPSHGREVGLGLRERKATRTVPIVFPEGEKEKVERIRSVLPHAVYGSWDDAQARSQLRTGPSVVGRQRILDIASGSSPEDRPSARAGNRGPRNGRP